MSELNLPDGWCLARIADITNKTDHRIPEAHESFIYVDIGSINRELKSIESPQHLIGKDAPSRARKIIKQGDVLVSLTRPNLNAVALVSSELDNQIASTGFEVLKPVGVDNRFVFAITRSKDFVNAISESVQGALYPAAKSSDVQSYEFPLPPLAEQKVIAEKLDEMLAKVERIKARLERIPQILKQFRQSVLANSVSGKFNDDSWITSVKKLSDIADFQNGHAFQSNLFLKSGKTQVVKLGNIRDGLLLLENSPAYVDENTAKEYEKFAPKSGDILISMTGTRFKKDYGFCCLIRNENDLLINQRVGRIVPNRKLVIPEYLYLIIQSDSFRNQFFDGETGGVNQGNVGSNHILNINIELPSIDTQQKIVTLTQKLTAYAENIAKLNLDAMNKVNKLTQSILAKAFKGELTKQWRKENPDLISGQNSAETLLAKIKTEMKKK